MAYALQVYLFKCKNKLTIKEIETMKTEKKLNHFEMSTRLGEIYDDEMSRRRNDIKYYETMAAKAISSETKKNFERNAQNARVLKASVADVLFVVRQRLGLQGFLEMS